MASYTFDKTNKIITVDLPTTEITIQDLIDNIRNWEDELSPAMDMAKVADAAGKDDLGGGAYVGITLTLRNGWRIKFADRPGPEWVICNIFGGNLVATDENGVAMIPVAPAAYVTSNTQASQSPSIQTLEIQELKYRIESQRGNQAAYGQTIYWDPYGGDDLNDGSEETKGKKTLSGCLVTLGENNHGDVIFALSTDPTGVTVASESVTISSNRNTKIRGPGVEFVWTPSTSALPVVSATINGFGIEGLTISGYSPTVPKGTQHVVVIDGVSDYFLGSVTIAGAGGVGLHIINSDNGTLDTIDVKGCSSGGVVFEGCSYSTVQGHTMIHYNGLGPLSGDGLKIISGTHGIHFLDSIDIHNNGGYGVYISEDSQETFVNPASRIYSNSLGDVYDLGTESYIGYAMGEEWVTQHVTGASATIDQNDILSALSAYDNSGGVAREASLTGISISPSSISAGTIDALSAYGVTTVSDLSGITGVSASVDQQSIIDALSAYHSPTTAFISDILQSATYAITGHGNIYWTKIVGIPLEEFHILVDENPE